MTRARVARRTVDRYCFTQGLEPRLRAEFTNDLMDLEHATIASFCGDYLTGDALSWQLYEDIAATAEVRLVLAEAGPSRSAGSEKQPNPVSRAAWW